MSTPSDPIKRRTFLGLLGAGAASAALPKSSWAEETRKDEKDFEFKGKLIPIGGAINPSSDRPRKGFERFDPHGILQRLILEVGGAAEFDGKTVVVVANAAANHKLARIAEEYEQEFRELLPRAKIEVISTEQQAEEQKYADIIADKENTKMVFFGGGDQKKLVKEFKHTPAFEAVKERLRTDAKFILAGTSAGAAAMSEKMIYENSVSEEGFGFTKMPIDTHTNSHAHMHMIRLGPDATYDALAKDANTTRDIHRVSRALRENDLPVGLALQETSGVIIDGSARTIEGFGLPGRHASFVMQVGDQSFKLSVNEKRKLPDLPAVGVTGGGR